MGAESLQKGTVRLGFECKQSEMCLTGPQTSGKSGFAASRWGKCLLSNSRMYMYVSRNR